MKKHIGIRREDKNQWERRVPLIPTHVRELIQNHPLDISLQPSAIRVFPDSDYEREGAKVEEDLSSCSVIFAVKEIPLSFFEKGKVYVFFSHTTKGQPHNMPMLKRMIDQECTLIDYEKIIDDKGRRLLFFGKQAGQAGMIDTLWALGKRLLQKGRKTPFVGIQQAHRYERSDGPLPSKVLTPRLFHWFLDLLATAMSHKELKMYSTCCPLRRLTRRNSLHFSKRGIFSPTESTRLCSKSSIWSSPDLQIKSLNFWTTMVIRKNTHLSLNPIFLT